MTPIQLNRTQNNNNNNLLQTPATKYSRITKVVTAIFVGAVVGAAAGFYFGANPISVAAGAVVGVVVGLAFFILRNRTNGKSGEFPVNNLSSTVDDNEVISKDLDYPNCKDSYGQPIKFQTPIKREEYEELSSNVIHNIELLVAHLHSLKPDDVIRMMEIDQINEYERFFLIEKLFEESILNRETQPNNATTALLQIFERYIPNIPTDIITNEVIFLWILKCTKNSDLHPILEKLDINRIDNFGLTPLAFLILDYSDWVNGAQRGESTASIIFNKICALINAGADVTTEITLIERDNNSILSEENRTLAASGAFEYKTGDAATFKSAWGILKDKIECYKTHRHSKRINLIDLAPNERLRVLLTQSQNSGICSSSSSS